MNFKLTFASNAHSKQWTERELSLDDLRDLCHPENRDIRDDKDGIAFVCATLLDGKRNAKSVNEVYVLTYDIDGAQTLDEVDALLDKFNHTAFLYTTHSHKVTETTIVVDHYEKWAKLHKKSKTPSEKLIKEYLVAKGKGYLVEKNVQFKSDWYKRVADKGNVYYIKHDPVDKLRVLIPLASPIDIAKLSPSNADGLDIYKSIYTGIGKTIGFDFDPTCSDPCRLFYIPSCPENMKGFAKSREYDGDLVDWAAMPRIAPTKKPAMDVRAGHGPDGEAVPYKPEQFRVTKDGHTIDILDWYHSGTNKFDFDIEGLIQTHLNEQILTERSKGGWTITCPFEAEHTTPGGEGTFAANADGTNPWTIHCMHASCQDAGRRKLDFLKGWIELELLPIPVLIPEGQQESVPSLETAAKGAGLAAHTLLELQPLQTVEENVTFVEDKTNVDEVVAAAYKDIKEAKGATKCGGALDEMNLNAKGVQIPSETFLELTAPNGVSVYLLTMMFKNQAKNYGWFKDMEVETYEAALKQRREDIQKLDDAVAHILSMGFTGHHLQDQSKKVAAWYGVDPRIAIQKLNTMLGDQYKLDLDQKLQEHFPQLSKRYAKIKIGANMEYLDEEDTRKCGQLVTFKPAAFKSFHENMRCVIEEVDSRGNKIVKSVQIIPEWLENYKLIREYRGVTFDPRQGNPASGNVFNLWPNRWYIDAVEGDVTPMRKHMLEVWCDNSEELLNWTLLYFADLFQRPWNKPASAICLMGDEGSGKSIIFDKGFKPILGSMYNATARREQLVGKFNKAAEGKLFWLAEESLFSGDKQGTDVLKDLITRDTMTVEPKGKDTYEVPNHIRYVFTSNRNHPLNLSSKDRRYFVLTTNNKYMQDTTYHEKLSDWFTQDNGPGIWLNYIMDWKPEAHGLAWRDLYTPPMTKGKTYQIEMSRDAGDQFFVELLKYGKIMSEDMSQASNAVHIEWPLDQEWWFQGKARMQNAFNHYLKEKVGSKAQFETNQFNKLWEKYFINLPFSDKSHVPYQGQKKVGPQGKNTKVWVMGKRQNVITAAVLAKLIHADDATEAFDNPTSHITINDNA